MTWAPVPAVGAHGRAPLRPVPGCLRRCWSPKCSSAGLRVPAGGSLQKVRLLYNIRHRQASEMKISNIPSVERAQSEIFTPKIHLESEGESKLLVYPFNSGAQKRSHPNTEPRVF